jgi:hypothetical protein
MTAPESSSPLDPPEPPIGSLVHLANYYGVYERVERGWIYANEATGRGLEWETLVRLNSGATPVPLVPAAALEEAQRELAAMKKDRDLADECRREADRSGMRLAGELTAARADAERMRRVVKIARELAPELEQWYGSLLADELRAAIAAVDTYESQESTDER